MMTSHRILITILLALLLTTQLVFAQTDSTEKRSDSLNTVLLSDYNKKLAEIEKQRIADSAKRADLQKELDNLKTTDNLKKEELQKELQGLNEQDAIRLAEKKARIDSLRATAKSYPVKGFFNDTLFLIFGRIGSFSAQERSVAIENRIQKLADNFGFKPDSLKVVESERSADLTFGETIITSVTENDAIWNNTTKTALAEHYKQIIGDEVVKYKAETSFATLAKEIGLALALLILMVFLIRYLSKLFRWTAAKIAFNEGKRINGIKLRNYTLFDAKRQVNFLFSVNTFIKWVFIVLLIYIMLPILFGIFPWTENFASTLFGYILNPLKKMGNGLWNYLPNLITIIVVVAVFHYIVKGMRFFKTEIETGKLHFTGFYPDWANPTFQILKVILYAFMFVLIFPYLPGSDSPIFQGVSVFLGVLFTFGSSGALSNIMAGLVLTYMRLFKLGDRVKIGEVIGDVIEKSLLVTRVRTIKNEIISVPNSTVMNSHTINYSSEVTGNGLIMHTTVTIGYDVPWKNMYQALLNAADRTDFLLKEPKPFVLQTSLEDFYVSYQINAYTKEPNRQATIYSMLHSHIQDCCNEAGIEILSPHYRAARDGSATTIPAEYLEKDFQPPPFNVNVKSEDK